MTYAFPSKTKRKINNLCDLADFTFIFGGKDKKGVISNSLYKVFIDNENVSVLKVDFSIGPEKRFSCCFHYVGNNTIILYGGKRSDFGEVLGSG